MTWLRPKYTGCVNLPGWDSLETVSRLARIFEVGNIVVLAVLVGCEVLAYSYGHRKEELAVETVKRAAAEERENDAAELRRLAASIPAPVQIGTVFLEVHDKYTHATLRDTTCTVDGRMIRPGQRLDFQVGEYPVICTHAGYFAEDQSRVEVRPGETSSLRIQMEQVTGTLAIAAIAPDGQGISHARFTIDGKPVPTEPGTNFIRDLPARSSVRIEFPERTEKGEGPGGVETSFRRWGTVKVTATVRGGVETPVNVTLPLLERRDRSL
jgi:hypothetical protein